MQTPLAPLWLQDDKIHRRKIAEAVNAISAQIGSGTITLTPSATTTTLTDQHIGASTVVLLMPTTAHASAAFVAGIWFSGVTKGAITLNHASSANVDQTFSYICLG